METRPTVAKLLKSLEHPYVKNIAEYLVLHLDTGTYGKTIVLSKPFEEKIQDISDGYDEDLTLTNYPSVRIVYAAYTTKKDLSYTLEQSMSGSQN